LTAIHGILPRRICRPVWWHWVLGSVAPSFQGVADELSYLKVKGKIDGMLPSFLYPQDQAKGNAGGLALCVKRLYTAFQSRKAGREPRETGLRAYTRRQNGFVDAIQPTNPSVVRTRPSILIIADTVGEDHGVYLPKKLATACDAGQPDYK